MSVQVAVQLGVAHGDELASIALLGRWFLVGHGGESAQRTMEGGGVYRHWSRGGPAGRDGRQTGRRVLRRTRAVEGSRGDWSTGAVVAKAGTKGEREGAGGGRPGGRWPGAATRRMLVSRLG